MIQKELIPDAAVKAIEAIKKDIILIAGGYDKDSSFDDFVKAFDGRVKALLLMGKTATKIKDAAEKSGIHKIHNIKRYGSVRKRGVQNS